METEGSRLRRWWSTRVREGGRNAAEWEKLGSSDDSGQGRWSGCFSDDGESGDRDGAG
jgi:hypothetical protein